MLSRRTKYSWPDRVFFSSCSDSNQIIRSPLCSKATGAAFFVAFSGRWLNIPGKSTTFEIRKLRSLAKWWNGVLEGESKQRVATKYPWVNFSAAPIQFASLFYGSQLNRLDSASSDYIILIRNSCIMTQQPSIMRNAFVYRMEASWSAFCCVVQF